VIVAHREEPVVAIPVIVKPIEVELALRVILVEVEDVAITVDLRDGALYKIPSKPLPVENSAVVSRLYRIRDV